MNDLEVKELFEEIIDDTLGETTTYILMQVAEDKLVNERDWYILRTLTTITRAAGATIADGVDLPTDFNRIVGDGDLRSDGSIYKPISIEDYEEFKDVDGYYYIDYSTNKIHFCGTASVADVIRLPYIKWSTALGTDLNDGIDLVWPRKYGAILAYDMAGANGGAIDGDDINFQLSQGQLLQRKFLHDSLVGWDQQIRLKSMGGRTGIRRDVPPEGNNRIDIHG